MRQLVLWTLVVAAGCGSSQAAQTAATTPGGVPLTPLYERLGGHDAVVKVVDAFVAKVAADKRINGYFWNADVANLKQMLFEQICEASGGPCKYSGKDMKTAHAGMNLKDSDFSALVEDLVAALDQYHVPAAERQELLGILGPLKGQVVGQ